MLPAASIVRFAAVSVATYFPSAFCVN
jgi:hypothetical protein